MTFAPQPANGAILVWRTTELAFALPGRRKRNRIIRISGSFLKNQFPSRMTTTYPFRIRQPSRDHSGQHDFRHVEGGVALVEQRVYTP
jgi:hypothetical protein